MSAIHILQAALGQERGAFTASTVLRLPRVEPADWPGAAMVVFMAVLVACCALRRGLILLRPWRAFLAKRLSGRLDRARGTCTGYISRQICRSPRYYPIFTTAGRTVGRWSEGYDRMPYPVGRAVTLYTDRRTGRAQCRPDWDSGLLGLVISLFGGFLLVTLALLLLGSLL